MAKPNFLPRPSCRLRRISLAAAVRRISWGISICPRPSMRLTAPVAFVANTLLRFDLG
jgi:hypothetical protein